MDSLKLLSGISSGVIFLPPEKHLRFLFILDSAFHTYIFSEESMSVEHGRGPKRTISQGQLSLSEKCTGSELERLKIRLINCLHRCNQKYEKVFKISQGLATVRRAIM